MSGREGERGNLESLLISIAVHLAVILLVPYVEQPVLDVYPLDIAGVIEIATIEAAPAAPAPAPGVAVQEVTPKPKPQAPEPAKPEPVKPIPAPKPTPKPKVESKAEPKVTAAPEPARQEPPKQEKPEVVTSPAGTVPPPVVAKDPPESRLPDPGPIPEPTPEPAAEPVAVPQATQVAKAPSSPGVGRPDGAGTIPRPEYPGEDPTGHSMVSTGSGGNHGVWIPKGVQNVKGRGEALVRIRVRADGSIESMSFLEAPPHPAMAQVIQNAISTAWRFAKDSTPGRADSYYLDVRVGYDGGTEDVWVESERASYIR